MKPDEITKALRAFAKKHRTTFYRIAADQSKKLELAATMAVADHYRAGGLATEIVNPRKRRSFVVKASARGHPANYSRIRLVDRRPIGEIHMNLAVRGAHDEGVYCIDVAIVRPGAVPENPGKVKWVCTENEDLVSFAEVKNLVVYPMLLAQFVGIVHELKPRFLRKPLIPGFGSKGQLLPALITLGHFSGNSKAIVESFRRRGIQVVIAENFDMRLAWARNDDARSPLYWEEADTGSKGAA